MELTTLARIVGAAEKANAILTEIAMSEPVRALTFLLSDDGAADMRHHFAVERAKELRTSPLVGYLRP